jgi:transposase-like protein
MARDTREVWTKRVERLADSGLTAKEFAEEIGVNANTLAGWRWRLSSRQGSGERRKGEGPRGPPSLGLVPSSEDGLEEGASGAGDAGAEPIAPMRFVELTTKPPATPAQVAPFEIVLRSGRVVRVTGGFDAAELTRLVGLLEEVRS